ncbi:MAG: metalloprotease TldD, partial [Rhodocyclaceae bacterium]|nr:metalloprotease TldD [Rhodocyclaceae bacterium]
MNAPVTAPDALAIARPVLLAAHELDDAALEHTFSRLMAHRLDYADLYFQHACYEGWNLEEGIVKSGSFSIDQGVGVRAICGEKTAFAYSDDLSAEALRSAVDTTRAIAAAGGQGRVCAPRPHAVPALYGAENPL